MKKQHQDFLRKQNKLRTKPPKRIARKEKPAPARASKAQPVAQPAAKSKDGES